jgi:hypothetical protein
VAVEDSITIGDVLAANTDAGSSPSIVIDDAIANAGNAFFVTLNPPLEITR